MLSGTLGVTADPVESKGTEGTTGIDEVRESKRVQGKTFLGAVIRTEPEQEKKVKNGDFYCYKCTCFDDGQVRNELEPHDYNLRPSSPPPSTSLSSPSTSLSSLPTSLSPPP